MPEVDRTKLSELYPRPKTYTELKQERVRINEIRRPKHVPLKSAGYSTGTLLAGLIAVSVITSILTGNMSSTGQVLALVCFSILVGLMAFAVIGYLLINMNSLMSKVLISNVGYNMGICLVFILIGLVGSYVYSNGNYSLFSITCLMALHYGLSALVAYISLKLNK